MPTSRLLPAILGLAALYALTLATPPAAAAEVKLDADLGQSVLGTRSSDRIYLRLSLKTLAAGPSERRASINTALVIDRSGSMQGERLAAAQEGARVALDRLSADDIVSLIAYNHEVDVLEPAARLGAAKQSLARAIDRLRADGTTALYAGVEEGGRQVKE